MRNSSVASVKRWFVRRVVVDTALDERIVDAVVSHQFAKARKAINEGWSVELSGFGRFYFMMRSAKKKFKRLSDVVGYMQNIIDNPSTSDDERRKMQFKLGALIGDLKTLERKIEDGEKAGYDK